MAFKFTDVECDIAATELTNSAARIEEIVNDFETEINSVNQNYQSESATAIIESINKVKNKIPAFKEEISECSKYLTETVKPAYQNLEAQAKQQVEGN